MSWYRVGKISITRGEKTLIGYGTKWADNKHSINRGHIVLIPGQGSAKLYEIEDVKEDGLIVLTTPFEEVSVNQVGYAIINTLTSTVPDFAVRLAAQLKYNQELFTSIEEWVGGTGNVTITLPNGNTIEMPSVNEINKNIAGKINIGTGGANPAFKYATDNHGYFEWFEGGTRTAINGFASNKSSSFEIRNEKNNGDISFRTVGTGQVKVNGKVAVVQGDDGFHGSPSSVRISSEAEFLVTARGSSYPSMIFRNDRDTSIGGVPRYSPALLLKAGDTWGTLAIDYNTGRLSTRSGLSAGTVSPPRSYLFSDEVWSRNEANDRFLYKRYANTFGVPMIESYGNTSTNSGWVCIAEIGDGTSSNSMASRYLFTLVNTTEGYGSATRNSSYMNITATILNGGRPSENFTINVFNYGGDRKVRIKQINAYKAEIWVSAGEYSKYVTSCITLNPMVFKTNVMAQDIPLGGSGEATTYDAQINYRMADRDWSNDSFIKKSIGDDTVQRVDTEGSYLNRFDILASKSDPNGRLIRAFALPDGRVGLSTRAKNGTWMGDISFPERGNGVFSVDGTVLASLEHYSSQELKQLTNAKMGSGGISDEYFIIGPASANNNNKTTSTAFLGVLRGSRGSTNAGNNLWEYSLYYQNAYTGTVYDLVSNFTGGSDVFTGLYFATYKGKRVLVAKLASTGGEQHNGCLFSGSAVLKDADAAWRDMDKGQNLSVTTGASLTDIEFKKPVSKNITSEGVSVFQRYISIFNTGAGVVVSPSSGKDATYLQFNTFSGTRRGYIGFGSNESSSSSKVLTIRNDDAGAKGKSLSIDEDGISTESLNLRGTESARLKLSCEEDNSNYIAFFNNSSIENQNRTAYMGFGDKNLKNFTIRNDKTSTQFILGDKVASLNGAKLLVWGDYGLGSVGLRDSTNNVNSFICTSDTNQAQQLGYPGIGAGIQTTYGSDRRGQFYIDTGSRLHFRFSLKAGADTETKWNRALAYGEFGIGSQVGQDAVNNDFNNANFSGFYAGPGGGSYLNPPPQTPQGNPIYGAYLVASRSTTESFQLGIHRNEVWFRPKTAGEWLDYQRFYTSANTTVDSNGFIKKASPIVKLFNSKLVVNNEAEGVTYERVNTGHYIIRGVLGFNSDGAWGVNGGIVIPKDENDQPIMWVKTKVIKNGDIEVKTYHRQHKESPEMFQNFRVKELKKGVPVYYEDGDVVDIPETTWIDLRVEMPKDSIYEQYLESIETSNRLREEEEARIAVLSSIKESQEKILNNDTLSIESSLKD